MIDFWKTAFSIGSELQDSKDKSNTMDQLGIIERLEAKIDNALVEIQSLKQIVLNLEQSKDDGIGEVLTLEEAAKFEGISKSGMTQRVKSGTVPYIKNTRGRNVFTSKYLKLARLAPDQARIDQLTKEMWREFGYKGKRK